jgi:cytochrome c oxidase assembly protein subunit 15
VWVALSLLAPPRLARAAAPAGRGVRRLAFAVVALVFVMVLSGGLVAGIRAGFAYNTFPLMNGRVVPPEFLLLEPVWRNFFWNMATVQFDHRAIAAVLACAVPWLAWRLAATPALPERAVRGGRWLLAMLVVQIALGIATLVLVVPLPLAALHQAGALMLFALALNVAHALR